jgi:hypothetical protein
LDNHERSSVRHSEEVVRYFPDLLMEAAELRLKSVETALEWSKQIIALASGILVVSGTFVKELFGGRICGVGYLIACWIALTVCVLFGLLFVGSLCSLLAQRKVRDVTIYCQPAQFLGLMHFLAFFAALIFFTLFSLKNIGTNAENGAIISNAESTQLKQMGTNATAPLDSLQNAAVRARATN